MIEVIKAIFTGASVGVIFALIGLPVPAPAVLAGVAGVFGLWAGYALVEFMRGYYGK